MTYEKWIDQYDSEKYIQEKETYIEAKGGDGTLYIIICFYNYQNETNLMCLY